MRYAAVSAIEHSHITPVSDIQWIPDHFEVIYHVFHHQPSYVCVCVCACLRPTAVSLLQAKTRWSTPHGGCSLKDGG